MTVLPTPDCRYGFSYDQITAILGDRLDEFGRWMRGQTIGFCDGREYDHVRQEWVATECGPHGSVVYPSDLRYFLAGLAPLD